MYLFINKCKPNKKKIPKVYKIFKVCCGNAIKKGRCSLKKITHNHFFYILLCCTLELSC